MRYVLLELCERDMTIMDNFDSVEEARDAMIQRISELLSVPKEDLYKSYLEGEHFDANTCILENQAYTEYCGQNFDWKIWGRNELFGGYAFKYPYGDARVKSAERCLIDNGIEESEAKVVLQALGYILMDTDFYPEHGESATAETVQFHPALDHNEKGGQD